VLAGVPGAYLTGADMGYMMWLSCSHPEAAPVILLSGEIVGWVCPTCWQQDVFPEWVYWGRGVDGRGFADWQASLERALHDDR
jgi:hypothetical protein